MNEETKARSFRISEETAEKFKALCADFPNQNAALDSLIHAYEVQSATAILVDRQTDISDYSSHIQALGRFRRGFPSEQVAVVSIQRYYLPVTFCRPVMLWTAQLTSDADCSVNLCIRFFLLKALNVVYIKFL